MEKIKKKINYVSGSSYNVKVLFSQNIKPFGFFVVSNEERDPVSSVSPQNSITGSSNTRLSELRTYSTSSDISKKYMTSTSPTEDGVNTSLSDDTKFVYYIGGITYETLIDSDETTTFNYIPSDPNLDVDNKYEIYDEFVSTMVESPAIQNDVFIVRQEIPIFENTYRLENIKTLSELKNYAGGSVFNIIDNI